MRGQMKQLIFYDMKNMSRFRIFIYEYVALHVGLRKSGSNFTN